MRGGGELLRGSAICCSLVNGLLELWCVKKKRKAARLLKQKFRTGEKSTLTWKGRHGVGEIRFPNGQPSNKRTQPNKKPSNKPTKKNEKNSHQKKKKKQKKTNPNQQGDLLAKQSGGQGGETGFVRG